jgi:hypothetical protein
MNKEALQEMQRKQLCDQIQAAYLQCEKSGGYVDLECLRYSLSKLSRIAKLQGFSDNDFYEMAQVTLPEPVFSAVYKVHQKVAA